VPTVRLAVRVKPGASRTRVGGCHDGPYGPALVVMVNAPAVDGRATAAAVQAVARILGVPAGRVAVRSGTTSRDKLLEITDPPAGLLERAAELRDVSG
jgi:uncharacterized protein YggU (UPF0235/DUF167 family)